MQDVCMSFHILILVWFYTKQCLFVWTQISICMKNYLFHILMHIAPIIVYECANGITNERMSSVRMCWVQLVSSRDALSLPGVDRTLLSDADLRVRGFGLPDGLSSLAGDLAEKPIAMGGATAPASAVAAVGSGSLVGRFNKHSQRLLLQQLLQPAAAAAVTGDKTGHKEKLQLLVQQDELLRRQRGVTTGTGVPAADPKDAATSKPLLLVSLK